MFKRLPYLATSLFLGCLLLLQGCTPTQKPPAPATTETPVTPPASTPAPQPEPAPEATPAPETPPTAQPTPVEVAEPKPQPVVTCPVPKPEKPMPPARPRTTLPILGIVELVSVDPPGVQLEARLDTGISGSSLDARNIRQFERDGAQWVKFQIVDRKTQAQAEVSRPIVRTTSPKSDANSKHFIVKLRVRLGDIDQFVEFTLMDRSASQFPVVLGRNFLRDQALVDVARRFTAKPARP